MAIPRLLKQYALFIDGEHYAGKADIELPTLTVVTEEYAAGGMSGKIKADMALMEAMDVKFTLYEYIPDVLKFYGLANGQGVRLVARGAQQSDDATQVIQVKLEVEGQWHEAGLGSWEAGSKVSMEGTVNARDLILEIGGDRVIHINPEMMIREIGGEDQMAQLRGAIGI
jgi:P2 family phage contractile tail tube protein